MKKLVMIIFTLGLLIPSQAYGNTWTGPSRAEAIVIAERWIAQHGLVNPCVGRLVVHMEEDPHVDGIRVLGYTPGWHDHTCDITLRSGMDPISECQILAHEYMHIARGPEHDGPLSPESHGAEECEFDPRSSRQILYEMIYKTLPKNMTWRVSCGESRCRATSSKSRYIRRFSYRFDDSEVVLKKLKMQVKEK